MKKVIICSKKIGEFCNFLFRPKARALKLFKEIDFTKQPQEFFKRQGTPYHSLQRLGLAFLGRVNEEEIKLLKVSEQIEETINLSEMYGCAMTKYKYGGDYCVMTQSTSMRAPKDHQEATTLEQDLFQGLSDYISRKGRRANVAKIEWDSTMWFENSGGSHRSAALWYYDKQNGIDRPIQCLVKEYTISKKFLKYSQENDIYILSVQGQKKVSCFLKKYPPCYTPNPHKLSKGISFLQLVDSVNKEAGHNYILIVNKKSILSDGIAKLMHDEDIFNLSNWAKNPGKHGWDRDHYILLDK